MNGTAFCARVLDNAELAGDTRFSSNPLRMENRDALEKLIEDHFRGMTVEQLLARLDEAGIANARMNTVASFLGHEQLHRRGRVTEIGSPAGPLMSFLPAITIRASPSMGAVPAIGEHTEAILAELGCLERSA